MCIRGKKRNTTCFRCKTFGTDVFSQNALIGLKIQNLQVVKVVSGTGSGRIHNEEKVQRVKGFIFTFPRVGMGWVWRGAQALRGGGWECLRAVGRW